jgi:hypothetical protein
MSHSAVMEFCADLGGPPGERGCLDLLKGSLLVIAQHAKRCSGRPNRHHEPSTYAAGVFSLTHLGDTATNMELTAHGNSQMQGRIVQRQLRLSLACSGLLAAARSPGLRLLRFQPIAQPSADGQLRW